MSTVPKRVIAKGETPVPRARDHEHVARISTQTTIFILLAVALRAIRLIRSWPM
jgi:hypothetical protein